MVLAPDKIETRVAELQSSKSQVAETIEEPTDIAATIKFVEAITGRRIREQGRIDYEGIQNGSVQVFGGSVEPYINIVQDTLRDHPFDAVAGPGYTQVGENVNRAIQILIKPGLPILDKTLLIGSIPSAVPLGVEIVYKEWSLLTPPPPKSNLKYPNRVTHTSERVAPYMAK